MTGEITFYSNGPAPRRNAIIENIDGFLSQRGLSRTINFPRISLRMNIKLTAEQTGNYIENAFLGNYCKIVVDDGTFYFFIENVIQVNPNTADLSLRMDTLNTFEGRYSFSPSCRTVRRHKDRFVKSSRSYLSGILLDPVFDDKDEGVFPPLRKVSDDPIRQNGEDTSKNPPAWFKVIYSYADTESNIVHNKVAVVGNSGVADYESDLKNFLYIARNDDPTSEYPLAPLQYLVRTAQEYIKIARVPYCPFDVTVSQKTISPGGVDFEATVYKVSGVDIYYNDDAGFLQSNGLDPAIPQYAPDISEEMISLTVLDQHFSMPRVYLGEAEPMMSNKYYLRNVVNSVEILDLSVFPCEDIPGLETDPWDALPDPKIYTSPFYQVRISFLEDSFSVDLEDLTVSPLSNSVLIRLDQYVSTNMDADVMFKGELVSPTASFKRQLLEYPYLFTITSKTEAPLISDAYINYMRNGYNYDVAQQKRNIINSWVGTGIKTIGGIASLALGGFGVVAGVSLITSSASSIYSNSASALTGEEEIARKIKNAAAQSPSISTMDSGINWSLNDGLVHKTVWKADDDVLASLNRFFHLFGYVTDEVGDPTPFFHTRKWFNFVMGEYIIEAGEFIEHQYIEELERRYKEGVTIYHWDEFNDKWNYEQDRFNTELSLMD